LRKADLDAILQNSGKPFGRAQVNYKRRASTSMIDVLETAVALNLPPAAMNPDPADAPPVQAVRDEVTALSKRLVTPDGRGVITAPRYHAPFTDANAGGAPA